MRSSALCYCSIQFALTITSYTATVAAFVPPIAIKAIGSIRFSSIGIYRVPAFSTQHIFSRSSVFRPAAASIRTAASTSLLKATTASVATSGSIPVVPMIHVTEKSITCSDGVTLAMKRWINFDESSFDNNIPTRKILCLHGWLDNAASFNRLAPLLLECLSSSSSSPTEIIALDFPGHGLSGHKSVDGPPQLLAEFAYYVAECVEALGWGNTVGGSARSSSGSSAVRNIGIINAGTETQSSNNINNNDSNENGQNNITNEGGITIIGHSMGAGVSVVAAAAFPEWFSSLILLEGAGPLARNSKDAARHVRAACQRRIKSNRTLFPVVNADDGVSGGGTRTRAKLYRNLDAAIEARLDTTRRMPGDQYLSVEAARDMVLRATVPATVSSSNNGDVSGDVSDANDSAEAVTFRHDPRLQWPSLQYYTREQVEAFYHDITCPVCLLMADDGWPGDAWSMEVVKDILKPTHERRLRGSHHFHADPDTVESVVGDIVTFMEGQHL